MEPDKLKRIKIRAAYRKWRRSDDFAEWFFEQQDLQDNRCYYCFDEFSPEVRYQVDHKIPIFKGGDNTLSNLCLACRDCNQFKSYHRLEFKGKNNGRNNWRRIRLEARLNARGEKL